MPLLVDTLQSPTLVLAAGGVVIAIAAKIIAVKIRHKRRLDVIEHQDALRRMNA
jgi:hypothetical protein